MKARIVRSEILILNIFMLPGDLMCPKDTRYCFEKDRHLKNYSEERRNLCRAPRCQTCHDICKETRNCLSMHSRQ